MPALEDPNALFLHSDSFNADKKYIDASPGPLLEGYGAQERFLTRISDDREQHFSRYGGEQTAYAHRMAETALAMSRVLYKCKYKGKVDLTLLPEKFNDYWQGYDQNKRPHGIRYHYLTQNDLSEVLWTFTQTPCELFFSYLACHRHLMAMEANPDNKNYAKPFGRNRHYHYLTAPPDRRNNLPFSFLETDLKNPPYLTSLQKFYANGGEDQDSYAITCDFNNKIIPFGCLTKGVLINWLVSREDYETLFFHMNDLFLSITGQTLPGRKEFLRAMFEIQYWYIHIMPLERGSLAVMNMFRYAMLAYYNRRKFSRAKWFPMAPNRVDVYPDLEALILRKNMDDFIEGSIRDLYCVDYGAYFT